MVPFFSLPYVCIIPPYSTKETDMAVDYGFFAFCSAVLNSKTARKQFLNPLTQKELFKKFNLTPAQIKAAKLLDTDKIITELKKELAAASKVKEKALCW